MDQETNYVLQELRRDTDKNSIAIDKLSEKVGNLATTINRATWTLTGGVGVITFLFFIANMYLKFKV